MRDAARRSRGWVVAAAAIALACTPRRDVVDDQADRSPPAPAAPAPSEAAAAPTPVEQTTPPERAPEPVARVELVIRDLDGRPVAGARVIHDAAEELADRTVIADDSGRVAVPGGAGVVVEAEGFTRLIDAKAPSEGAGALFLLPASTLAGQVVDARSGAPQAGVTVTFGDRALEQRTDADGRFLMGGLPPGRALVRARGEGVLGDMNIALGLAEQRTIRLPVERAALVEGRVRFADGAPCSSGAVTLTVGVEEAGVGCPICAGPDDTMSTSIGPDGAVRFELARALVYGVEVACDGAIELDAPPLVVGDRDLKGLSWAVDRGAALRGRVLDGAGSPVAGMEVNVQGEEEQLADVRRAAQVDDEGRFTIYGLPPGEFSVQAFTETPVDTYYEGERLVKVGADDVDDVVITVSGEPWSARGEDDDEDDDSAPPPSVTLRGVVIDRRGAPVAGAVILVEESPELHDVYTLLSRRSRGQALVRTDDAGAFTIDAPARDMADEYEAPYSILAFLPGGDLGVTATRSATTPVELQVGPPGSIRGRVLDRRGRPFPHFGIDLARERPRPVYQYARDGSFTVPGLPEGEYRLRLHTPEGDTGQRVKVRPGAVTSTTFTARGDVETMLVRVSDLESDETVPGCPVSARSIAGGTWGPVRTDEDGYAELLEVPAGPLRVEVAACSHGGRRYLATSRYARPRPGSHAFLYAPLVGHDASVTLRGDLGYRLGRRDSKIDPALQPLQVKAVRPGGPAARAGLRVGDVITHIDGRDVTGRAADLHDGLARRAVGAAIVLGLADGRSVELRAE